MLALVGTVMSRSPVGNELLRDGDTVLGTHTVQRANRPSPSARYGLQTQRPDPHPTSQKRLPARVRTGPTDGPNVLHHGCRAPRCRGTRSPCSGDQAQTPPKLGEPGRVRAALV